MATEHIQLRRAIEALADLIPTGSGHVEFRRACMSPDSFVCDVLCAAFGYKMRRFEGNTLSGAIETAHKALREAREASDVRAGWPRAEVMT